MCDQHDTALVLTASGAVRRVDGCMRSLVQFLNDVGVRTFDSCCGHGASWGHITVAEGDAERVRAIGLRICEELGCSQPEYPFSGIVDGHVNIVLPPILRENVRVAS